MAEATKEVSPYHYCYSNPISYIDPDGKFSMTVNGIKVTDLNDQRYYLRQMGIELNASNENSEEGDGEKKESKEEQFRRKYKEWHNGLSFKEKMAWDFYLLGMNAIHFWSDALGGPMGDDVTAVDKLEFHVKAIAGGHLLVIVKAGAGNSFKKALKIPKGYKKVKGMRSHGQPIFKKGNRYITPDVDGHNGGSWKMADSVDNLKRKSTRMGTYDENLNKIGD